MKIKLDKEKFRVELLNDATNHNVKGIIGITLNNFIQVFNLFSPQKDINVNIERLNDGWCYLVAHCVGKVLKDVYNIDVKYNSHGLHCWIEFDGVAYDTLYPEGYATSPVEEWLLADLQYNTRTLDMTDGLEKDHGYFQTHLYLAYYFTKFWFEIYGIYDYVPVTYHPWPELSQYNSRYTERRLQRYYKQAWVRFKPVKEVITNEVYPKTHYWHGEFEESLDRVLKPHIKMLPLYVYRSLFKYAKEQNYPVTRM